MKPSKIKCRLPGCENKVPETRKRTARYCSDEHAYEAKKNRSTERYHRIKQPFDEISVNEQILATLYPIIELKKSLTYDDLESRKFNWGVAQQETVYNNVAWRIVGRYAYYVEPKTKLVYIWKM